MNSIRKLLSRRNHEGVMTHCAIIRAEAESPDALVDLLTAEAQGVAGVLGVSVDREVVEARERIAKLRGLLTAAYESADQVDFEDNNGAMRKLASDLREAEPAALWFRRKRFVPEPKRLSDESAAQLRGWLTGPAFHPVDSAIREALSILRPEILRG